MKQSKIYFVLTILCYVIALGLAGYFFFFNKDANASVVLAPMLFSVVFLMLFRNAKKNGK